MGAAARREKYRAELRAKILNAAREIFVRDGYEGFTIRKLAKL
jgi:AcrR family transcriptional regulator